MLFFGQNKYTNEEDFEQFSVTKQGFLAAEKYKKIQFSVQWLYNLYLTKLKVEHFHCLLRTLKYKYCSKFRICPK